MTRRSETIDAAYFDALYTADGDPWRFATSDYERAKYTTTLQALARPRYPRGLEVGCSIGVFTRRLAARCDALLAIDASKVALRRAEDDCSDCANVTFRVCAVPADFPDGPFDLIVLSEVIYYFTTADIGCLAQRCAGALAAGGEIVMCHWLGETDYPLSGAEASDCFAAAMLRRLPVQATLADGDYRLMRLSAP